MTRKLQPTVRYIFSTHVLSIDRPVPAAINETFLKLCINSSPEILTEIFTKLRVYITGRIVEPTVAGGILASMCRSAVQAAPVQGLQTFIPVLVTTITARLRDRHGQTDKQDEELQFNLQLLGEVLSCTNVGIFRSKVRAVKLASKL